jgi:hypothetical protein
MRKAVHHNRPILRGSTFLQLVVTWNALYSLLVFIAVAWAGYAEKLGNPELDQIQRAWYGAVLFGWIIMEPPRLALGLAKSGQSVAHLFGFVILTVTVHVLIMAIYNAGIPFRNSLDTSISAIQLVFAAVEIVLGGNALRNLVRRSTIDFYVNLGSVEAADEEDVDRDPDDDHM